MAAPFARMAAPISDAISEDETTTPVVETTPGSAACDRKPAGTSANATASASRRFTTASEQRVAERLVSRAHKRLDPQMGPVPFSSGRFPGICYHRPSHSLWRLHETPAALGGPRPFCCIRGVRADIGTEPDETADGAGRHSGFPRDRTGRAVEQRPMARV